ncbi:MAG: hypothetical protein AAGA87_05615 [Pseudomonadota bacterium]
MLNREAEPKSVGVVGDGDDVAIIEAIEDVFQVAIMDEEAKCIRTLGDAHSVICSKLPNDENEQTKCLTAMAYYRLNRAMKHHGKAKPSKRLGAPEATNPREFQKQLEEGSGLQLPFLTTSSTWVTIIGWSILATWIAGPVLFSGFYAIAVGILILFFNIAIWRFATRIDQRVWIFKGTLADLSRQASEENIGQLVSEGGKWNGADVWTAMTKIISDETGFPAKSMRLAMTFID